MEQGYICHFAENDGKGYADGKSGNKRVYHCEYRVSAGVEVSVHNENKAQENLICGIRLNVKSAVFDNSGVF